MPQQDFERSFFILLIITLFPELEGLVIRPANVGNYVAKASWAAMVKEVHGKGLSPSVFARYFLDTRAYHLWIISSPNAAEFAGRSLAYLAIEYLFIKFGQNGNGAIGYTISGLRTVLVKDITQEIVIENLKYQRIRALEEFVLHKASICNSKLKPYLLYTLKRLLDLRNGALSQEIVYSKPKFLINSPTKISRFIYNYARRQEFEINCKIIYQTMCANHSLRRYIQSQTHNPEIFIPGVITSSIVTIPLNVPKACLIVGLTTGGILSLIISSLYLFQQSKKSRHLRLNSNEIIIDVESINI